MKFDWSAIWESAKKHKRLWLTIIGLAVLLIGVLFVMDRCGKARDEAYKSKKRQDIQNGLKQIQDIQKQIDSGKGDIRELQGQKEIIKDQIVTDTQDLANTATVREDQRLETNQAIANFNAALHSNSNVNATADDLDRQAKRLQELSQ